MDTIIKIVGGIIGVLVLCGVIYGAWWTVKSINYWLWYDDSVKVEICEMVKPEALKNPQICVD